MNMLSPGATVSLHEARFIANEITAFQNRSQRVRLLINTSCLGSSERFPNFRDFQMDENEPEQACATGYRRLTLDIETYFDGHYSLKNKDLTMDAYIRDERFEMLVLAYAYDDGPVTSIRGHAAITDWIISQDWSRIIAIAQNASFDLGVLSFHFGISPLKIIDTMAMSRAVFGPGKKASLTAIAERLGLPKKTINYAGFKGKRFAELSPVALDHLAAGCERDVELTREIARCLAVGFPPDELVIIDLTCRMFTEPTIIGDKDALESLAGAEATRKASALKALGVEKGDLTSSAKFVAELEKCGVEVEHKAGKRGDIPSIAKTDAFMQNLCSREDRAGQLAKIRLDVQSSLAEQRARRLADMASRGPMPVQLTYCGAATTRWSGGGKVNFQNLPNARQDPELKLRGTIMALPGYLLVVIDFSMIEYRLLCGLAGEQGQLEILSDRQIGPDGKLIRDVYREFAETQLYSGQNSPISKDQRNFGKRVVLGCGYGMGHVKFAETYQKDGHSIELQIAKAAVDAFRRAHPAVVRFWKGHCTEALRILANADPHTYRLGPIRLKDGAVILPNGLRCPFVLEHDGQGGFLRTTRYGQSAYWGGAFTEFRCQSLSRVLLSDVILRAWNELGIRPPLHVHDEVVYCVPEADAEAVKDKLVAWMSESPSWMPDLPLWAEGWVGPRYRKS
jgi:DNA polymerase I-like protein with 3'-5' exonuclease and polymerase domains